MNRSLKLIINAFSEGVKQKTFFRRVFENYFHFPCSRSCAQLLSRVEFFATHRLQPARLLCPWNSSGMNPGVSSHSLLQGIFQTQGLKAGLLHCRLGEKYINLLSNTSIAFENASVRSHGKVVFDSVFQVIKKNMVQCGRYGKQFSLCVLRGFLYRIETL